MEHDLCGLCKNFDPCACWHNVIGAAQAMSCFAKGNGTNNNNKKDQLVLSSDDEDDITSQSRSLSSCMTLEPDSRRQPQQYLSPPLPDNCTLQGGLAGLVAKGTPKTTSSPLSSSPMSFSDALSKAKAKAAAETKEACEGDAPHAQTTTVAFQPRNMEEEEEEELHIPRSFDFGDQGSGAGREMPGAGTVDPFDAIGMLANLWQRMQVR